MAGDLAYEVDEEPISVRPRGQRPGEESEIDMTPMIDCVFLLLIFYMVTLNMHQGHEVDVPAVEHSVGVETKQATIITLFAPETADGQARIVLGDGSDPSNPEAEIGDVRPYVEAGLSQHVTQVVIKAERQVHHRDVQQVLREVSAVEGITPHIGVQDAHRERKLN